MKIIKKNKIYTILILILSICLIGCSGKLIKINRIVDLDKVNKITINKINGPSGTLLNKDEYIESFIDSFIKNKNFTTDEKVMEEVLEGFSNNRSNAINISFYLKNGNHFNIYVNTDGYAYLVAKGTIYVSAGKTFKYHDILNFG